MKIYKMHNSALDSIASLLYNNCTSRSNTDNTAEGKYI